MTIKRGNPPASTAGETNQKFVTDKTLSKFINISATSGVTALFDLNQQLYDNGLISKDCYVAIEAVVAEFMNCSVEDGE